MQHHRQWIVILLLLGGGFCLSKPAGYADCIDLSGSWRFAMDRDDEGIRQQWYTRRLTDKITLPGVLQARGFGDPIGVDTPWVLSLYDRNWYLRKKFKAFAEPGDVNVPFLSQPPRHYLGSAWYQRTITIPDQCRGQRMVLFLERTRWTSTVWIDASRIGSQDSLVAPHVYELGMLDPGTHTLTIRVDNRMQMNYRPDGHSVSDSLGSTWNGLVGAIELRSTTPVWIDRVQAFGEIETKSVRLKITIGNITQQQGSGKLLVGDEQVPVTWTADGGQAHMRIDLGDDAQLWSEFNPALQRLTIRLEGDKANDSKTVTFGLRQIRTEGNKLLINGVPSHFRGTHSGGDFPLTGYPATDVAYWRKLFTTCKAWGLNHVRFHSFCPPEAAFTVADELGVYLQPEAGMWNEISPGTDMEKRLYEETDRMLAAYGNHPSFVLFSPSNEPKGHWKEALTQWVEHYRQIDPRRLYTTGTGWPLIDRPGPVEGADFLAVHRIGPRPVRGNRAWFGRDYLDSIRGVDVPIIVHELGQWCAFPDFDVIDKFTGYMRPGNFKIFRQLMKDAGLYNRDKAFAQASGKFQAACYKEEIEANLRTPGLAGFQLLDLHDYVGQGTALVGVLDPFWEEKGYITADEWRRFCSQTVPLAVMKRRVFTTADTLDADIQIAHYGPHPIRQAQLAWHIQDARGRTVRSGQWELDSIPQGSAVPVGRIETDLSDCEAPGAYRLVVGLSNHAGENDWDFWVYPDAVSTTAPAGIVVTRSFDDAVRAAEQGGKVLFMPQYHELVWQSPPVGRVPIFWTRLMGPNWERFLGIVADDTHPALAQFPTESWYDWQWEGVFRPACRAVNLDALPSDLQPIVQVIDDWNRSYKLAALFECRIGEGKLMVCAADLDEDLSRRPPAAQLRHSLLAYMDTDAFDPTVSLTAEQFLSLRFDNQIMHKLGAVAQSSAGSDSAANAVDGNPNTAWTTAQRYGGSAHPHDLIVHFPRAVEMTGLVLMNRQDHRQREGDIRDYAVAVSDDGDRWQTVATGQLESTFDPQTINFGKKLSARYLKLRALSGFGGDHSASLAEIAVQYAGPPMTDAQIQTAQAYRKTASATAEMYEAVNLLEQSTNPTAERIHRVTADSESTTDPAALALDGNPQTFWHTQWRQAQPGHPHWLMLEFKQPLTLTGIDYLPRQDRANGRIKEYTIEVSLDGKQWQPAAAGVFQGTPRRQSATFAEPRPARYLRLTAVSEYAGQPFTSIAELTVNESTRKE